MSLFEQDSRAGIDVWHVYNGNMSSKHMVKSRRTLIATRQPCIDVSRQYRSRLPILIILDQTKSTLCPSHRKNLARMYPTPLSLRQNVQCALPFRQNLDSLYHTPSSRQDVPCPFPFRQDLDTLYPNYSSRQDVPSPSQKWIGQEVPYPTSPPHCGQNLTRVKTLPSFGLRTWSHYDWGWIIGTICVHWVRSHCVSWI